MTKNRRLFKAITAGQLRIGYWILVRKYSFLLKSRQIPDDFRRITRNHTMTWNVFGNYTPCTNRHIIPNCDTRAYHRLATNPHIVTNRHRPGQFIKLSLFATNGMGGSVNVNIWGAQKLFPIFTGAQSRIQQSKLNSAPSPSVMLYP